MTPQPNRPPWRGDATVEEGDDPTASVVANVVVSVAASVVPKRR